MWKTLALSLPPIRRLYEDRERLLAENQDLIEQRKRFQQRNLSLLAHSVSFHDLSRNHDLSARAHARCADIARKVQRIYEAWEPYVLQAGLDQQVFFPGNEWGPLVPTKGVPLFTDYANLNYLRLTRSYTGYQLPGFRRAGDSSFSPEEEAFAARLFREGVPEDVEGALQMDFDPMERLFPSAVDYVAHANSVPPRYWVRIPAIFGEMGLRVQGILVNENAVILQSRINAMLAGGLIQKIESDLLEQGSCRILEIGAGYGGMALAIKDIFPKNVEYIILDLPDTLYASAVYLSRAWAFKNTFVVGPGEAVPDHCEFCFVPNYLAEDVRKTLRPLDVVINTMSFGEMSDPQLTYYAHLASQLLKEDGVLYEENCRVNDTHIDVEELLAQVFEGPTRITPRDGIHFTHGCHRSWRKASRGS